jgi:citrate lyase subunit beta / citryl-CoA lyase
MHPASVHEATARRAAGGLAMAPPQMRSLLFVPADAPKKLVKALTVGADCLLIDLEDSVADASKPSARKIAADFIRDCRKAADCPVIYVRVNSLDTGLIDDDLDTVLPAAPDGILLPKSRSGQSVQHLSAKLAVREAESGLADGNTAIIAIATERAAALFQMGTYAGASRRLAGLTWGAEDLSVDLGSETNRLPSGDYTPPFILARSLTLYAAAAANVLAIDTIRSDFRKLSDLRVECEASRRDGFVAKMAIHPDQVPIINEVFTPSLEALVKARQLIAAFAANPDAGVVAIAGEMFDRPHLMRANRLVAGRIPKNP